MSSNIHSDLVALWVRFKTPAGTASIDQPLH